MVGENGSREYVIQLLKENAQLKQEMEHLHKRIHEMEPANKLIRYSAAEYFRVRVAEELARASRYQYAFSILYGELDNLDIFTRRNSKEAVNEILGMFEIVIQDSLSNTDLKFHFGAGRFGILLPYTDCNETQTIAEKIRQAVEKIFALKSQTLNIRLTASIGLACYPLDATNADSLLALNREAYACARTTGNTVCTVSEHEKASEVAEEPEIKLLQNDSFLNVLDDEVSRCSRYGLKFTLLVLAVTSLETNRSRFDVNARALLMRKVYRKLSGSIRTIDKCHLYTDSKFAVVLPGTGSDGSCVLAQKLIQAVTSIPIHKEGGNDTYITVSIGIAAFPSDEVTRDGLLRKVESALNHAAGKGDNQYSLATDLLSHQGTGQRDINEWITMLKDGGQNAIFNLLAVVDMTERYEPAHSQSVARYAMEIGKIMGITNTVLRRLRIIAMLHDIGKICIPPAIITRPGPLRDDERELMMFHPQYGAAILEQLPDFAYCCLPVLSHHEMWDGNGYPHGIKGVKIPLESRIISVAEAFDDMITPRPYRNLLSLDDAITELRNKAGTQFDPAVVDAFLKLLPGPTSK